MPNSKIWDVILLTEQRYVNPSSEEEYVLNLLEDDRIFKEALEKHGLRVKRVDWADPDFDWRSTHAVVFRTTWDYFDRIDEFKRFLQRINEDCILINPMETITWNLDKRYLIELRDKGLPIPETIFVPAGNKRTLEDYVSEKGWVDIVIKPCIAGGARHTYRLSKEQFAEYEPLFATLSGQEWMMIQEFQKYIVEEGEISHMVMNGVYTHSILKIAKPGDFRVQDDYGGTTHEYEASEVERFIAESFVEAIEPTPLYARVDLFKNNQGYWVLGELELLEPELWFRYSHESAQLLADGIWTQYFDNTRR